MKLRELSQPLSGADKALILDFLEAVEVELKKYSFHKLMFDIEARVEFEHILGPVVYIELTYSPDSISRFTRHTVRVSETLANIGAIAQEEVERVASYVYHFARMAISSLALMEKEV